MIELGALAEAPEARAVVALVAVALLVAGRRLFWLAVATLGFCAGVWGATELLTGHSPGWTLLFGAVGGALGALVAVVLQKLAIALAGFLLGALATREIVEALSLDLGRAELFVIVLAGAMAGMIALALFSVALAVVTAGAGAALLSEALVLPPRHGVLLFLAFWILGSALQLSGRRRERR